MIRTIHNIPNNVCNVNYLVKIPDQRRIFQKILHTAHAAVFEVHRTFSLIGPALRYQFNKCIDYVKPPTQKNGVIAYDTASFPWNADKNTSSAGLYVFIHGLRGTPLTWEKYRKQVHQTQPGVHCFVPQVYRRGNCPLKEAADPILVAIQDYAKKHPGKTIYLVGVSHGALIAAYLERKLSLENTPIKLASIAGVHFGTKIVDKFFKLHLQKLTGLHPLVAETFRYGNAKAMKRLDNWRIFAKGPHAACTRIFYATTEDDRVRNVESALPKIGDSDQHYFIHGHSHNSIVNAVRDHVLKNLSAKN